MALNDNDLLFINDSTDANKAKSVKLGTLKENILTGGSSDTYVEVAGDNMTGDLTLGTDKITLAAANGSASFAGNVDVGDSNVVLYSNGRGIFKDNLNIRNFSGTDDADWVGLSVSDNLGSYKVSLYGDGSAEFAGYITVNGNGPNTFYRPTTVVGATLIRGDSDIGGTKTLKFQLSADAGLKLGGDIMGSAENIFLNGANGSAKFTGQVEIGKDIATASGTRIYSNGSVYVRNDSTDTGTAVWKAYTGGFGDANVRSAIYQDGSATFAGQVKASASSNQEARINPNGSITLKATESTLTTALISGLNNGNSVFNVTADGSITAAGSIQVGTIGANSTAPGGFIYSTRWEASDDVCSAGLNAVGSDGKVTPFIGINRSGGGATTTSEIKADGTATFSGTVTANGYSMANLAQL